MNVFVKNHTKDIDIIPGEILERVVKQFEAEDYASDKPVRCLILFSVCSVTYSVALEDWIHW